MMLVVVLLILPGLLLLPGDKAKLKKGAKLSTAKGYSRLWKDADKTPLNKRVGKRKSRPVMNFENPKKIVKKTGTTDPVVQTSLLGKKDLNREALAMPEPIDDFPGMNFLEHGAGWPPDTCGDVGLNYYVQAVNVSIGIFDKDTGDMLSATTFDDFFEGPAVQGTPCDENNNGDPIVLYDQYVQRWIIFDFAWDPSETDGSWFSIAASKTSNPRGEWWLYAFRADRTLLNDYPKGGVWNDGIYLTANMFSFAGNFQHAKIWAFKKPDIYNGSLVAQSVTDDVWEAWAILPSHAKGSTPPPEGSPNYMYAMDADEYGAPGQDAIFWWRYIVDWNNPANTVWDGSYLMSTAAFGLTASGVPQPCGPDLDSLYGRLMNPAIYRNFGSHASVYLNHLCEYGGKRSERWYEIRINSGTSSIYQQSTYAPDSDHRWMGSIAADKYGNIALGYSVSNSGLYPSIRYAGRLANDPLNQLSQGEASMIEGTGCQYYYNRWGDYSSMTIDPADDETFWYTQEYYVSNGTNWQTRIGYFKYANTPDPPEAPTKLTAKAVNCNRIDLSWQDNADNERGFVIERSLTGTRFAPIAKVGADQTTYSDTNVEGSTTYWYRVKAFNKVGYSDYSNIARATTPACPGVPAAPSDLKGKQTGKAEVTLWWVDNSENEELFILYRGTLSPASISANLFEPIAKIRPNTEKYIDKTVKPGSAYCYKVCAVNKYGESCSRPIKLKVE